jgi:hypothetical protein
VIFKAFVRARWATVVASFLDLYETLSQAAKSARSNSSFTNFIGYFAATWTTLSFIPQLAMKSMIKSQ